MWLHYLLISIILISGLICLQNNSRLNKKIYLAINFLIFTMLAAFRDISIGNDTYTYFNLFKTVQNESIDVLKNRFEVGYLWLNKLLGLISSNPQILFIITSIIIMTGFSILIYKYSNSVWMSVFLFYSLGYFGASMNTIRQCIAMTIIFLAYHFILENKIKLFLISVILATTFHKTAIVFLVAYPLLKMPLNKKNIFIMICGTLMGLLAFNKIFDLIINVFPIYSYYENGKYIEGGIKLASIINTIVLLCIFLLGVIVQKECSKDLTKDMQLMNKFIFISICISILSFKFNLLDRLSDYFSVFSIIFLPNIIKKIKQSNRRIIYIYSVISLFFIYYTIILHIRPEWNQIYPYKFFG